MEKLCVLLIFCAVLTSIWGWTTECPEGCTCVQIGSNERQSVSCLGVDYFPGDYPEGTTSLEVHLVGFPGIPESVFSQFKTNTDATNNLTLDQVTVSGEVGDIHSGAFSFLNSSNASTSLSFQGANIHTIEKGAFANLRKFKTISFTDSSIKLISQRSFSDISQLESLAFLRVNIGETCRYAFCGFERVREISFTEVSIDTNQGATFIGITAIEFVSFRSMVVNFPSSTRRSNGLRNKPFFALIIGGNNATLLFSETHIPSLPANSFYGIVQFRNFLIEKSSIGRIGSNAFSNIDCIQTFSILDSKIEKIDRHAFNSWTAVRLFSIHDTTSIGAEANDIFYNFNNVYIELPPPSLSSVHGLYSYGEQDAGAVSQPDVDFSNCISSSAATEHIWVTDDNPPTANSKTRPQSTNETSPLSDDILLIIGLSSAGGAVLVTVIVVSFICIWRCTHRSHKQESGSAPILAYPYLERPLSHYIVKWSAGREFPRELGVDNPAFPAPRVPTRPQSTLGGPDGSRGSVGLPHSPGQQRVEYISGYPAVTACGGEDYRQARYLTLIEACPTGNNTKEEVHEIDDTKLKLSNQNPNSGSH